MLPGLLLLGCASPSARAEGVSAPVELQEAHLPPFGSAELEKQRTLFKTLLEKSDETITIESFGGILGDKMTLYKGDSPTGQGKFVDIYFITYSFYNYMYNFSYADEKSGENTSFGIISNFEVSDETLSDSGRCLTLENIKDFAEAGGWTVDDPFVEWMQHGFTATKQRLQLRAVARRGGGEWPLPGQDNAKIAEALAFTGCVQRLSINRLPS